MVHARCPVQRGRSLENLLVWLSNRTTNLGNGWPTRERGSITAGTVAAGLSILEVASMVLRSRGRTAGVLPDPDIMVAQSAMRSTSASGPTCEVGTKPIAHDGYSMQAE